MTHISLLFTNLVKRPGRMGGGGEIFRKSSLNFTFGQGSCLISDFNRPHSNKAAFLQISLRCEIVIFNNKFAFCVMSSFCSMS